MSLYIYLNHVAETFLFSMLTFKNVFLSIRFLLLRLVGRYSEQIYKLVTKLWCTSYIHPFLTTKVREKSPHLQYCFFHAILFPCIDWTYSACASLLVNQPSHYCFKKCLSHCLPLHFRRALDQQPWCHSARARWGRASQPETVCSRGTDSHSTVPPGLDLLFDGTWWS